jgi:hypothetical protein
MKIEMLFELLKKIEKNKNLKKKLKIFLGIGIFSFFILGGLAIWLGLKAVNYVGSKTIDLVPISTIKVNSEKLNSELTKLSRTQAVGCWEKAQSLIAVEVWLERSASDNFMDLKASCWGNNLTAPQQVDISEKINNK